MRPAFSPVEGCSEKNLAKKIGFRYYEDVDLRILWSNEAPMSACNILN